VQSRERGRERGAAKKREGGRRQKARAKVNALLKRTTSSPSPITLSLSYYVNLPPRTDIEDLVGRTSDSGPVSSFAAFVRLLVGALHRQSQGEGDSKRGAEGGGDDGGGRIEWPTPEELEGRLQAARRRRKDTNPLSMTTTISSSSSSKRYLILTHTAGAARVGSTLRKRECLCRHVLALALAVISFRTASRL